MANELPKQGDLIQERENLKSKIQAIQAQKLKDIEEKVLGIEQNREQIKNLDGLLKEARENFTYYENLKESGQLPEDELENYDKAKKLVLEIEEKMAIHNEASEKIMAIPEVESKIQAEAGEINDIIEKEKKEKIKEELVEKKFSNFFDEVIGEAKEVKEALDKLSDDREKYREKVLKIIGEKFGGNLFNSCDNSSSNKLRRILEDYRGTLGKLSFGGKRQAVDKILSSKDLEELENKDNEYRNFLKLKLGDSNRGHAYLSHCVSSLFANNDKYIKKYLEIGKFAFQNPYVNSMTILNKVLEDKGVEVGILSDRDFSNVAIDYERKNKQE